MHYSVNFQHFRGMKAKIWLITGCSRGIGKVLAEAVLKSGDAVAGTARDTQMLDDLAAKWPANFLAVKMDMNVESEIAGGFDAVIQKWGRIDVLVNNAGYGLQGMIEEVTISQVRQQLETNFFGLFSLTQKVLPVMRSQKSGYIVNISSVAGLRGSPGFGIYNASKFAVEGFTEALAAEVKDFGIRVSVIEPGPYRTDWAGTSLQRSESMAELKPDSPYFEFNKKYKEFLDSRNGNQPGDPAQIASVLINAANHPSPPLHMVFGDIAVSIWEDRMKQYADPDFMSFYPHQKTTV